MPMVYSCSMVELMPMVELVTMLDPIPMVDPVSIVDPMPMCIVDPTFVVPSPLGTEPLPSTPVHRVISSCF